MKYTFSVIIPVYQVEPYIADCLDSVTAQAGDDVQIILVDDGSTDRSGEICDRYAADDARISVLHQANGGVAAARNAGLRMAQGTYILWVDPDDWVEVGWLSSLRAAVRSGPDLVLFDYSEYKDGAYRARRYGRTPGSLDRELLLQDAARDVRMRSSLWDTAIRHELYEGLQFDETLRCLEDYALLHHLIMRAQTAVYLDELLYVYRMRDSGLVRTRNLAVSYSSYQVSLRRREEILASGRSCPAAGVLIQAKEFCRNYLLAGDAAYRGRYEECRAALCSGLPCALADGEIPLRTRLSMLLFASRLLGGICARLRRQAQEGRKG